MTGIFDQITEKANSAQKDADGSDNDSKNTLSALDSLNFNSSDDEEQPGINNILPSEDELARTEKHLRDTSQDLLRFGLLEESHKPNLYRTAVLHMEHLTDILEPLDLSAHADEIRGLVYLKVRADDNPAEQDDWSHPLVRKQRLTLEQSLLIAILRQYFIAYEQEAGTGSSQSIVAVDELIPQLQVYLGDMGSEAKERNRIINLLDQLKGHGLVSSPDTHDRITIRPMIAHLANPENLQALLNGLKQRAVEAQQIDQQEGEQ